MTSIVSSGSSTFFARALLGASEPLALKLLLDCLNLRMALFVRIMVLMFIDFALVRPDSPFTSPNATEPRLLLALVGAVSRLYSILNEKDYIKKL